MSIVLTESGKKFADNVLNNSITKLSLLTNSFFKVEKIIDIEPNSFSPAPRVMSSMIKLTKIDRESISNNFKKFIFRELFFYRDRKLKNNLMEALISFAKVHGQKLTKKESKTVIDTYGIPKETLNKMMENLSNEEYEFFENEKYVSFYASCKTIVWFYACRSANYINGIGRHHSIDNSITSSKYTTKRNYL